MAVKIGSMGISVLSCLTRNSSHRFVSAEKIHGPPPKKPVNSFLDFLNQKRAEIKRNNPGAGVSEVAKIGGLLWKDLNQNEKQMLQVRASERMEAYKVQLLEFMDELTPAEREELKTSKQEHRKKLKHKRHRAELHRLGKPKHPLSPFFIFVRASKIERGDAPVTDFVKSLAERWKIIPEEEKQIYMDDSLLDRERYYIQLEAWEARMIREGRPDLVRGYKKKSTRRKKRAKGKKGSKKPRKRKSPKRKSKRKSAKSKKKQLLDDEDFEE